GINSAPLKSLICKSKRRSFCSGISATTRSTLFPDRAVHPFRRAIERLEFQIRSLKLERPWIELPGKELRILQRNVDHQPLTRSVQMHALDRGQRCGMQQTPRRLPRLFHVLIEHAGRVVAGLDHERVAFEVPDRMPERRARAAFWVFVLV